MTIELHDRYGIGLVDSSKNFLAAITKYDFAIVPERTYYTVITENFSIATNRLMRTDKLFDSPTFTTWLNLTSKSSVLVFLVPLVFKHL